MLRCFRPVRTNYCWAPLCASALVRRAETVRAEVNRWCNEVQAACADERVVVRAEATVFELTLLREGERRRQPKPSTTATFRWPKPQERRGTDC